MPNNSIYRVVAQSTTDGILVLTRDGQVLWANPKINKALKYIDNGLVGKTIFKKPLGESTNRSTFNLSKAGNLEIIETSGQKKFISLIPKDGGTSRFKIDLSPIKSGKNTGNLVATLFNASLPQNPKFEAHEAQQQYESGRAKGVLGVLAIDLEKFTEFNDIHGQLAGDAALLHVAAVLNNQTRADCTVTRTGNDEFQIKSPNVTSIDGLTQLGNRLIHAISQPFSFEQNNLRVFASIGASLANTNEISIADLVHQARMALTQCKQSSTHDVIVYTPKIHKLVQNERNLLNDLKEGIKKQQVITFLQPQLDIATNKISGFEALIRWQHPERGLLSPFDFLPMAEEHGLVAQLDNIAMHHALRAASEIGKSSLGRLNISINASEQSLAMPNYANLVQWTADAYDVPLETISIEILETTVFSDTKPAITLSIENLRALGIAVSLDDFGTGFAGLAHMSELDVDAIKIDRSLIQGMEKNIRNQKIVKALISLCLDLEIKVVVEGAETDTQVALLEKWKCPIVQGYGIAIPMPVSSAIEWVQERKTLLGQNGTVVTSARFSNA